ncbi:MAG: PIG-L family deacetylase [Dehalococcoidia bacterium]
MVTRVAKKAASTARRAKNGEREPTVEEKWATYSRALIITAHPDDAEFLAGGTVAKMCAMGWEVTLAVATSGDKGTRDANLRPQELAAMREAEQRAAADVLGLHRVVFWGMPDGWLEEGPELRGMVVKLIRQLKPDVVVTWDGFRAGFNHTDHRAIGRAVRDALYPAAHDPHYYGELTRAGIGPWRTAELLLAGSQDADCHVDIGPYLEKKVDAILCHKSQIEARDREEMLKGWRAAAKRNKDRRKQTGFEFAESFKRMEFRRPPGAPGTPAPADAQPAAAKKVSKARVR